MWDLEEENAQGVQPEPWQTTIKNTKPQSVTVCRGLINHISASDSKKRRGIWKRKTRRGFSLNQPVAASTKHHYNKLGRQYYGIGTRLYLILAFSGFERAIPIIIMFRGVFLRARTGLYPGSSRCGAASTELYPYIFLLF